MPIDWLTLAAALLSGLLGGAHCAAMCGGIATGFSAMSARNNVWSALELNLGRIVGYVLAGAIAGGIGHGIVRIAQWQWLTLGLRMLVGMVLITVALRLLDQRRRLGFLSQPGTGIWPLLKPLQRRLSPANTRIKRIGLSILWGWLPCGLSSTLLAAAWLQANAINGALTMAAFGLGTLPIMWPLTYSGARLGRWLQQSGWRITMATIILLAGMITIIAPWLMKAPTLHGLLSALGCQTWPT